MPSPAAERAKEVTVGGMSSTASREVMAAGRETVQRTATRWRRVTDGNPCGFCAMVASRGPVYRSEATARGAGGRYHDHCGCTVEPHAGGQGDWQPTEDEQRFIEAYEANYKTGMSDRELSQLMDEWLADRTGDAPLKELAEWAHPWRDDVKVLGPWDGLDDLSPEDYAINGMKYTALRNGHAYTTEGGHLMLVDFKLTAGELKDLQTDVGRALAAAGRDLGGRPVVFHASAPGLGESPGSAWVIFGTRTVEISPRTARLGKYARPHSIEAHGHVHAGGRVQTLIHELGHVVDGHHYHTRTILDRGRGMAYADDPGGLFKNASRISDYAQTNPTEAYAEAYLRWKVGGPDPGGVAAAYARRFGWH